MTSELRDCVIVFLGPSMPLEEAQSILDAHYLPPARQGDVLSAVQNFRPMAIGLVDGEFSQALSVWHKEILYALEQGVQVYGAASMGALRAAETHTFGMTGIGEIFSMFRDGVLQDDDEVALQYAPAADQYRNLSMPMVNIRATLERACSEGRIDREELDLTIKSAKSLFFRNRVTKSIHQKLAVAGLDEPAADRICLLFESHFVDLKRSDTRQLLQALASVQSGYHAGKNWNLNPSAQFRKLLNQDRKVRHSGIDVTQNQIVRYAALHHPDFNMHNFNARNRVLALLLAELLQARVDDSEINTELKRFRSGRKLLEQADFESWLAQNDLDEEMFLNLMEDIATCRKLHRWLNSNEPDAASTQAVLDELRLQDAYPQTAARAANLAGLSDSLHPNLGVDDEGGVFADLVAEQIERTEWALETECAQWVEEAGFPNLAILKRELLRARGARSRTDRIARQVANELFSATLNGGIENVVEPDDGQDSRKKREN